jgi:hypothetical protein
VTPEERAALAAVEHYDQRAKMLRAALQVEPWTVQRTAWTALGIIARARSAELRDPLPDTRTLG